MKISDIRIDDAMQSRAQVNAAVVAEYAERLMEGAKFPAVTVFFDGTDHWLADGFHRAFAYLDAGCKDIEADVKQGSRRDALLHSVGVNAAHGLQRTNEDKRKAVRTLLNDVEWSKWSDREVARRCGVGHTMVSSMRPSLSAADSEDGAERTYTTKHGTVATMDTSNLGKAKPAETPPADPAEPEVELDAMGLPMANWIKNEPRAEAQPAPAPEDFGPSDEEIAEAEKEAADEQARMRLLLDNDAPLAAANERIKQLQAEVAVLKARIVGLTNECATATRLAKSWRLKVERMERV